MTRTTTDGRLDRLATLVATHSLAVVLLVLAVTAGMVVGIGQADFGGDGGFEGAVETDVDEAEAHIATHYGLEDDDTTVAPVFVREESGTVLSREAMVATLEYTKTVRADPTVADALAGDPLSVASLVGTELAGANATLEEQAAAIEAADERDLEAAILGVLEDEETAHLLPTDHDPETLEAESTQVAVPVEAEDGEPPASVETALHEAGEDEIGLEVFTIGEPTLQEMVAIEGENTLFLVLPAVLALVIGVAAFAYRDPVDVAVGVAGVLVSIVWMFGLLGWLGVEVGPAVVVGPVLVAAISIDFGFHVFTRYREERSPDAGIRRPMGRGLAAVAVAFALVTLTASVGFLSNVLNPVEELRALGLAIALGVVAAFVVFVTLVPALTVTIDAALERRGRDRRRRPLGQSGVAGRVLGGALSLALRGAPAVVVLAVLLAGAGGLAWADLEEEPLPEPSDDVPAWKQSLPGPAGWSDNEPLQRMEYVGEHFVTAGGSDDDRVQVLVEGNVTAPGSVAATQAGLDGPGVESPASVIEETAATNDTVAATVEAADTTGDELPDTNLEAVYDALFAADPAAADRVIERSDGEYETLRVVGPPEGIGGFEGTGEDAEELAAAGTAIEDEGDGLTATVVSGATHEQAAIEQVTDGIVRVMALALAAVSVTLLVVYRRVHGSATLGALTATSVLLVLGFVAAGMAVLDVPLNFLTALLVSLVIGVGIDYAIHLSDRYATELENAAPAVALETAVTGTGGALLGSMLTSVAAFVGLLLHPGQDFQAFATLVILAMVGAFLAAVVVLPSMLTLWARLRTDLDVWQSAAGQTERQDGRSSDHGR